MEQPILTCLFAVALCAGAAVAEETMSTHPPIDTTYLHDHALTRGFTLGRPVKPRPTPDGRAVLFLRATARKPQLSLYEYDPLTRRTRLVATPETLLGSKAEILTPEERARRERMRVSTRGFTDFQISPDGRTVLVSLSGRLHLIDRTNGKTRELSTGKGTLVDPKFAPDGSCVSYVLDHDVFAFDLAKNRERRITTGGSRGRSNGLAEFVAQEEMGRFTGYWWAPDSRTLAFEEADTGSVENWWVADPAKPGQEPFASAYPRPGKENARVRLGLVAASGGKPVWVEWDDQRYPYLTTVRWDEFSPLTISVQTREQNEIALLVVDPKTGMSRPLLTEKDSAWVPIRRDVPRWLDHGEHFVWSFEGKNENTLEVIDREGRKRGVLFQQKGGHLEVIDWDLVNRRLWIRASEDSRTWQILRIDVPEIKSLSRNPPRPVRLTEGMGIYAATLAKNHSLWVEEAVTTDSLPTAEVRSPDGRRLGRLPSVSENPSVTPRAEFVEAKEFHAVIVRPRDFNPELRYPVIVDVYGGPAHNKVVASMSTLLLPQWLADCGFVVVSLDNRGTPGRGRDWERAIRGKLGDVPLEDQVEGLRLLCQDHPEMDAQRVGIVGWSFGGYLSALAVLKRPEVFSAAVAGAPVVDWTDYDTHYTERYLGLPQRRRADYERASLLTYAKELSRPLLIIHGTADDNVFFLHSLRLAEALFRAGRPFEILPLPGLTHMVPDPVVTERLWARIAGHFRQHLGAPEAIRRRGGR